MARYKERASGYPGAPVDYAAPPLEKRWQTIDVNDTHLSVLLPPAIRCSSI